MDFEQFKEALRAHVIQRMEDVEVSFCERELNNGIRVNKMVVEKKKEKMIAEICIDGLYMIYHDRNDLEDVAKLAVIMINEHQEDIRLDSLETLHDWNQMKDRVMYRLINRDWNRERLKHMPHKEFLDLAIVFYMITGTCGAERVSMEVTEEFSRAWQVDADTLFEAAKVNTPRQYPYCLSCFGDIARQLSRTKCILEESIGKSMRKGRLFQREQLRLMDVSYSLSNTFGVDGAAVILYDGFLKKLGDTFQQDYYIVPKSMDSLMVFQAVEGHCLADLEEMLTQMNLDTGEPEKILSNNVYIYRRESGALEIAEQKKIGK